MEEKKVARYVSYLRVSTKRQGQSGLGLDAQRTAIIQYLNGGNWSLDAEFVEVESGKKSDRPVLKEAIAYCKRKKATLLIAKLDRLARNVAFVSALMESKIEFKVCDNPTANRLTIHILASIAEYEGGVISQRVKSALQEAKKRGVKLGSPQNLTPDHQKAGRVLGTASVKAQADTHAQEVYEFIKEDHENGKSLAFIADRLNDEGFVSARGSKFYPTTVKNIIDRMQNRSSI